MADQKDFSVSELNQAAWLCYINGLEIPIVSGTVTYGVGIIPTASIQLVPSPFLHRIGKEDRLQVALFYLDDFYYHDDPQFCLLGEFEVIGWSYAASRGSRYIQLDCMSPLQIFTQWFFYYMSSVDDIAESINSDTATARVMVGYPHSLFLKGLGGIVDDASTQAQPVSAPSGPKKHNVNTPTSEIEKVINDAAAKYSVDPTVLKGVVAVESNFDPNAYDKKPVRDTDTWEIKHGFKLGYGLMQLKPSSFKALTTEEELYDPVTNMEYGTRYFKSLLDLWNKYITEWNSVNKGIPDPYKLTKDDAEHWAHISYNFGAGEAYNKFKNPKYQKKIDGISRPDYTLVALNWHSVARRFEIVNQVAGKAGASTGFFDPKENMIRRPIDFIQNLFRTVLLPIAVHSNDDLETLRSVEAGSGTLPPHASSAPNKNFFSRWINTIGFDHRWAALPLFEDSTDDASFSCFPLIKVAQDSTLLEVLQNQVGQNIGGAGSAWDLLQRVFSYLCMEIATLPAPPAFVGDYDTFDILGRDFTKKVDRHFLGVLEHCVKPQCFFAIPPMCNVIFPSMLRQFTFRENYMQQPTRVYLDESYISDVLMKDKSSSIGSLTKYAMVTGYPDVVQARMETRLASAVQGDRTDKNLLIWPEEFFKGPVSRRLNAPPWLYLLKQYVCANLKEDDQEDQEMASGGQSTPGQQPQSTVSLNVKTRLDHAGQLFRTYAKYEFYRSRALALTAGAALAWNPYIVPGFPSVIFDDRATCLDVVGYVNTVTHSFSADKGGANLSTQIGLLFVRTLQDQVADCTANKVLAYPDEPIPAVKDIFQNEDDANAFYNRLFYQEQEVNKALIFKYPDVVQQNEKTQLLSPTAAYAPFFSDYSAAMRMVSRPACTLKEYIAVKNNKLFEKALTDGDVKGINRSFHSVTKDSGKSKTSGAVFWARIFKLRPGPGSGGSGTEPPPEITNINPNVLTIPPSGGWSTFKTEAEIPQTRQDWDSILEEYRIMVRGEGNKQAPQQ